MTDPIFHMISNGPRPVAPFSHAVEADGWVLLTGQMPTDPEAPDAPLPEGVEAQTRRVMDNLALILDGLGLDLSHVVQMRAYLTEFERDYATFNATYQSYFPEDRRPATALGGGEWVDAGGLGTFTPPEKGENAVRALVVEYEDGRVSIRFQGVALAARPFHKDGCVTQGAIVENKLLSGALSEIRKRQQHKEQTLVKSAKTKREKRIVRDRFADRLPPPGP